MKTPDLSLTPFNSSTTFSTSTNRSRVMSIANTTVRNSKMTRSLATKSAWSISLVSSFATKIRGVAQPLPQKALARLAVLDPSLIHLRLTPEPYNSHDRNACAVMASWNGSGDLRLGYLAAKYARVLVPLFPYMSASLLQITGGQDHGWGKKYYGMNIRIKIN